jgi:hypothetical protein
MNHKSFAEAIVLLARSTSASSNELANTALTPDDAARQWLTVVDSGDYVNSWNHASGLLKNGIDVQNWQATIALLRNPLGALLGRLPVGVKWSNAIAGLPDGKYVVVQFNSSFANKAVAVETVGLDTEDGHWAVTGYFIE